MGSQPAVGPRRRQSGRNMLITLLMVMACGGCMVVATHAMVAVREQRELAEAALREVQSQAETIWQSGQSAYRGRDWQQAVSKFERALAIYEDAKYLNSLAWILAVSPDDAHRDGPRSVQLAERACELTDFRDAMIVDTLAAAYAEIGDFEQAVKYQRQAVKRYQGLDKDEWEQRLAYYEVGRPYRELPP